MDFGLKEASADKINRLFWFWEKRDQKSVQLHILESIYLVHL